jgi:antitoxin component HigA of HigAB toxin-antitoxin module
MKCLQEIRANLPTTQHSITKEDIIEKIKNVSQYLDKSQLEQTLRLERNKVKRFVFTALEGEYYEIPPKVANIIATHLEDSV